jgi:hypothetical protein
MKFSRDFALFTLLFGMYTIHLYHYPESEIFILLLPARSSSSTGYRLRPAVHLPFVPVSFQEPDRKSFLRATGRSIQAQGTDENETDSMGQKISV